MAESLGSAILELRADGSGLDRDIQQAEGRTKKSISSASANVGKVGAGMTMAFTAPIIAFAKIAGEELADIERTNAQTGAVIKSTGGAAGVTAQQIQTMAKRLQGLSGVDDQAIQSGENLLLTFTKVQNKAGKGNKIFDRASVAMLDLSVAMKTDVRSAALQVGKALNDPVKGTLALSRAGIQFTGQQKAQIKAMVGAGDQAGAQKLILGELERQVGGSAEAAGKTFPAQLAIMQDALAGVGAEMLSGIMPAVQKLAKFVIKAADAFGDLPTPVKQFAGIATALVAIAGPLLVLFAGLAIASTAIGVGLLPLVAIIAGVVIAIAALITAGIWLYQNWDEVKAKLAAAWDAIQAKAAAAWAAVKDAISTAWDAVKAKISTTVDAVRAKLQMTWDQIKTTATGAWASIVSGVVSGWTSIKNAVVSWAQSVVEGARSKIDEIIGKVTAVWASVRTGVSWAWGLIKSAVVSAANSLVNSAESAVDDIVGKVTAVWASVRMGAAGAWGLIKNAVVTAAIGLVNSAESAVDNIVGSIAAVWTGVRTGAAGAWGLIKGAVVGGAEGVVDGAVGALNGLVGKMGDIGSRAGAALAGAIRSAVNGIIDRVNGLSFGGFSVGVGKAKFTVPKASMPNVPRLAAGGILTGPTLALAGEYAGVRSNPEVVAPLDRLKGLLMDTMAQAGGSGGANIIQNFQGEPDPWVASRRAAFAFQTAGLS